MLLMIRRVTEEESSEARSFAEHVLSVLQDEIRDKYRFQFYLVGSAKYNTVLTDRNGWYDLDYQISLTSNSNNSLRDATQIKSDFFNWFNRKFSGNHNFKVENSTTAITLYNKSGKYSIDFVILRLYPEDSEIIRRNNSSYSIRTDYTWNQLPSRNRDAYRIFDTMNGNEQRDLIDTYILPRKAKEKMKDPSDPSLKSSTEIFIEEVNNYAHRTQKSYY